ncbi:rhomboid family intramembrane serine protease [Oleiagrimonas soli]|uniref:Membrane associated rhomboid family serine protease n=1 Tax=Oleiagrimonas soli TaxID=1543381 RepID=A0A099CRJ3_9GAMM|nr:rhomboid family intramembrane serine protease [Oleiagrimonas soli]KGI76613.1 membrane protein [Oleiagrimonas soli]MBB6184903.1 membrane associated rhomboid family serine protease [Oleiagrimonas soli]
MFVNVPDKRHRSGRWATLLLVVLCVAMFTLLMLSSDAREMAWVLRWGTVPSLLFETPGPWWQRVLDPDAVRLLTALFIHISWLHLLGNMLFLVIFGLEGERVLGSRRFLLLFLSGGMAANLVGALTLAGMHAPIIGCSGAVSAVVGAYLVLFPRARLGLVLPLGLYMEFVRVPAALLIALWVLLQLAFTYAGPDFGEVVWWSHIAGFVYGMLFAMLSRHAVMRRMRR